MKNFKFLTFAFLAVFGVSSVIFLNSCNDSCKDVKCFNRGTCHKGKCYCEPGYTGTDCTLEKRIDLAKEYMVMVPTMQLLLVPTQDGISNIL